MTSITAFSGALDCAWSAPDEAQANLVVSIETSAPAHILDALARGCDQDDVDADVASSKRVKQILCVASVLRLLGGLIARRCGNSTS